jgi:hypothetical protein
MKKIYSILAGLLLTASVFAQAPQKMSYQAVIRNSSNALITSTPVGMKISILQDSSTGTAIYVETQTVSTNANGLVSIEIGAGTIVKGTFATINWANGPYYIKTETDPTGGTNYNIIGTSQLLSVPYALYAANSNPGPQGIQGIKGDSGARGPTGPAGTNAGVGGFTHYIGEAFDGGIIYYLYKGSDGLEHGLIVALTESTAPWQTSPTLVNANRSWDGAYNTALMTGSPAATYIAGLGAGWYLPSIDELGKLYYNRFETNKALFTGGNALLSSTATYWSSTEYLATDAYTFYFYYGYASANDKTNPHTVRGVRAF